jgi:NAD(P)-dependent dehydrogenase (short-subunit alcohol dehydrogenase family)
VAGYAEGRPAALVTGGRRGIGRAIAWALAEAGFDVAIADIVEDEEVPVTLDGISERGGTGLFVAADIAELDDHGRLADAVWERFGGLECLVNNAGVQVEVRGDLLEATPESYDRLMRVNLRGPYFLTQRVAKRMLAEPEARAERSIVSISSANAIIAATNRGEYCLSKIGVSMMTRLFALRLAEHGIRVHEIRPGTIHTEMTAPAREDYTRRIAEGMTPIRRWGQPEDIGRTVAALASGALPYTTGEAFHVDGGLHIRHL